MESKDWVDFKYDASISYSHVADTDLAPALQKAMQAYAKGTVGKLDPK